MKTFLDVAAWCDGAAAQFGDPSAPVGQAFFRWHDSFRSIESELACLSGGVDGEVELILGSECGVLALPVVVGEPTFNDRRELEAYGLALITDGVWAVTPSLNAEGLIHVFVVIYGVPVPAPWEHKIIVPAGSAR